jgi:DNA polymerase gamma 1
LTVNESWDAYLRDAERTYKNLELSIKKRLVELAEQAKTLADGEEWKDDPWLSRLDWTPKTPRKVSGVGAEVCSVFFWRKNLMLTLSYRYQWRRTG